MKKKILRVDKSSADTFKDKISELRRIIPDVFSENKIDWEKLKLALDREIDNRTEKYGLSWAGKSEAFRAIRIPATGTLVPQEKESKDFGKTQNIFIEGDNLEALKLLQKHYREKIKMIYIDPPYNTGKDFIYKDNFTEGLSDYYERTGQAKEGVKLTSNMESNGRYHSDWLTMMYPRLFMARNLLREDGVIFISIDDNEVHNLRMVMDEIFGEENFVATFMWKRKKEISNDSKNVAIQGEYIVCYSKSDSTQLKLEKLSEEYVESSYNEPNEEFPLGKWRPVPITVSKGLSGGGYKYEIKTPSNIVHKRVWAYPEESFSKLLQDKRIYFGKNNDGIPQRVIYEFESSGKPISNYWDNLSTNKEGKKEIIKFFGDNFFDTPKPTELIIKILTLVTDKSTNDIVLDFFAGSGTTAHAVMDLNAEDGGNRKWILVQIPEEVDEKSEAKKAGFNTIAEIARERIRRAGKKVKNEIEAEILVERTMLDLGISKNKELKIKKISDLGYKSFKLSKSNYRQWNVITDKDDEKKLKDQMKLFIEKPLVDDYDEKSVVYEILTKEGFDLNAKVEQVKIGKLEVWTIADNERKAVISFTKKLIKDQVDFLGLSEDYTFVCLDSALDDTTKVNLMRNYNIKVI